MPQGEISQRRTKGRNDSHPKESTVPHQARWRWSGVDWNEVGKLEVYLPARKLTGHMPMHIKARVEDCDGDLGYWEVYENGVLVACGSISAGDPLWQNGDGPKLEAERVITRGATPDDLARAKAYMESKL